MENDEPRDGLSPDRADSPGGDADTSVPSQADDLAPPANRRDARKRESAGTDRRRSPASRSTGRPPTRSRITVVGVLGELLITAGVVVMLFLGWYIWLDDIISGTEQQAAAVEVQEELQREWERAESVTERPIVDNGEPVVAEPPAAGQIFATLRVPRFGAEYVRSIAGGIDLDTVLNSRRIGVGHYPDTQMPGEMGNFAIAAHRNTYGGPFSDIDKLRVGDMLYVETADGWYEYAFRGLEYVWPTHISVLEPVPREPEMTATDRILTLTSCNPRYSSAERIIAYAVMENWYPRAGGPPAALSGLIEAAD